MFWSLFKKTIGPFGIPLALVLFVLILARRRFVFLRAIPGWIFTLVIVLLIAVWVLVLLLKYLARKRAAEAIERGILNQAQWSANQASPARRAEIEEVRKHLAEAMVLLRRGPQGKNALYTIPWYLIIGPPAIGKTTAVVNSGLNFPNMTTARRMRGAGGTRNCDWWFSTDAILLDTAGRYAQSDDRSETEEEWFGFLDLLRKHRSKGPINGLILGYSMETLLQADDRRLIDDARELRQRMDEILDRFGWSFPVYVLFTKCDLVAGFADYFAPLSPAERQQVWGATFPPMPEGDQKAAERFTASFDTLMQRLRELRTRRMASLSGSEDWGRVFMFPEEFGALRGRLSLFMETLFEANPFRRDVPLFRGTYFSSGKQIGKPFDLVMQKTRTLLGIGGGEQPEDQEEREDAYFVRDLFAKVLKGDRDLVRRTRTAGSGAARRAWILSSALAVLSLLACLWIGVSYARLQGKIGAARAAAERLRRAPQDAGLAQSLDLLEKMRSKITTPWRAFPLTAANNAREAALKVYMQTARERVLDPLEEKIASALGNADRLNGDGVRQALRAELLLVMPAKRGDLDAGAEDLGTALSAMGLPDSDPSSPERQEMNTLAGVFLEQEEPLQSPQSRGSELLNGARRLDETHNPEEFFDGMVAAASRCAKDRTLASLVGEQTVLQSDGRVRAAFTREGWQNCVSEALKDIEKTVQSDEVMIRMAGGQPSDRRVTREDLLRLYQTAYPEEWSAFLQSIRLPQGVDPKTAADLLKRLKNPAGSPLLKLLQASADQAELGEVKIRGVTLFQSDDLKPINQAMRPLRAIAEGSGGQTPLAQYAGRLEDLYDQAASLADDGKQPDNATLRKARDWGSDYAYQFGGSPVASALRELLQRPADLVGRVSEASQTTKAAQDYQDAVDAVVSPFESRLARNYPFGDGPDANPQDVAAFFGPGGDLALFLKNLPPDHPPDPKLARCASAAEDVHRSLGISDTGLRATFTVKAGGLRALEGSTAGAENLRRIDRVTLTIDGKSLVDRLSGASETFTWSTDDDVTSCSLSLDHTEGNQKIAHIERDGSAWSWFQLVDQAKKSRAGDAWRLTWSFPDAGVEVDFDVTPRGGGDLPFVKGSQFRNFAGVLPRAGA